MLTTADAALAPAPGRFQNDFAPLDQIKTVRRFALSKDNLAGLESDADRTIGEQTRVMLTQPEKERVRGDISI